MTTSENAVATEAVRSAATQPAASASGPWRRLVGAAALVVVALLLAACGAVTDTAGTVRGVQEETGAVGVSIDVVDPAANVVAVRYGTEEEDEEAVRDEARRVAEQVWTRLPLTIGELVVDPRGEAGGVDAVTYTREELESSFGQRDPDLDQSIPQLVTPFLVAASVIGLLVLVAIVVVVVLVVRRSGRRPS